MRTKLEILTEMSATATALEAELLKVRTVVEASALNAISHKLQALIEEFESTLAEDFYEKFI